MSEFVFNFYYEHYEESDKKNQIAVKITAHCAEKGKQKIVSYICTTSLKSSI